MKKRTIKRLIKTTAMVFLLLLVVQLVDTQSTCAANSDVDYGIYNNVPWRVTSDYTLVIGQDGQTKQFSTGIGENGWPWSRYSGEIKKVQFEGTVIGSGSMRDMFYNFSLLQSVDLSGFRTEHVTDMSYMFGYCYSLKSINLSSFNTSNVTNMNSMFYSCESIKTLDLSGFDTAKVTDMSFMFSECASLKKLDVSGFDTLNAEKIVRMFSLCSSLERLDLSGFDTTKAYNNGEANDLFEEDYNLRNLCLGNKTRFVTENDTGDWFGFASWKRYQLLDGTTASGPVLNTIYDYNPRNAGWYRPVITGYEVYNYQTDTFSTSTSFTYTGASIKPDVLVYSGSKESSESELVKGDDFTVTYSNNKNVGTAKIIVKGAGRFSGTTKTITFKITPRTLKAGNVTTKKQAAFTGKAIAIKPTVKIGKNVLKKGTDYTVSYSSNKKVGLAKVIVKGKGNYKGKITKTFKIIPPKLKAKTKASKSGKYTQLTITLKSKPKCKVTRYRIQIATNKKFTKGLKKGTTGISGKKLYGYAKLKKGKTYYVRTRAESKVGGKYYNGSWSNVMKIKGK